MKKSNSIQTVHSGRSKKLLDSQKNSFASKNSKLESTESADKYKYKCGCKVIPAAAAAPLLHNSSLKILKKSKLSVMKDTHLTTANKTSCGNKTDTLRTMIKKLGDLEGEFKSLDKQVKPCRVEVISFVPYEVVRIVEKPRKVDRLIQRVTKTVRKVPKEFITYNSVQKQVQMCKEDLVFVDPEPVQTQTRYSEVHVQQVRLVPVESPINRRMRSDLYQLHTKSHQLQSLVVDSKEVSYQQTQTISNIHKSLCSVTKPGLSTVNSTQTLLPLSNQQIPFCSISPKGGLVESKEQAFSCTFLQSMASVNSFNLCEQIYLADSQHSPHGKSNHNELYLPATNLPNRSVREMTNSLDEFVQA